MESLVAKVFKKWQAQRTAAVIAALASRGRNKEASDDSIPLAYDLPPEPTHRMRLPSTPLRGHMKRPVR